jgi:hypothetical protein
VARPPMTIPISRARLALRALPSVAIGPQRRGATGTSLTGMLINLCRARRRPRLLVCAGFRFGPRCCCQCRLVKAVEKLDIICSVCPMRCLCGHSHQLAQQCRCPGSSECIQHLYMHCQLNRAIDALLAAQAAARSCPSCWCCKASCQSEHAALSLLKPLVFILQGRQHTIRRYSGQPILLGQQRL